MQKKNDSALEKILMRDDKMIIQWKKYIFKINEIYGSPIPEKEIPKADVHAYFQQKNFVKTKKEWLYTNEQKLFV